MVRILANDGMAKDAVNKLIDKGFEVVEDHYEPEDLKKQLANFDVIVVRSATKVRKPIIDAAVKAGRLKLIIRAGVGVDNIDVSYAIENGLKVMNTPKASSASVAELTLAHMLALARFVNVSNVTMREGKWEKKKYKGIELNGKTLGLIGSGRIAYEVQKKARALGMKVIYTNRSGVKQNFDECEYKSLEELLKNSDFVSLHIPYDKEKGAVIGKDQINIMKDGAYLINCARGGVVDEQALLEALNSGKLSGAGIDVYENEPTTNTELINNPKVSVTPHIGASTKEAQNRIGEEIYNIISDFFKK